MIDLVKLNSRRRRPTFSLSDQDQDQGCKIQNKIQEPCKPTNRGSRRGPRLVHRVRTDFLWFYHGSLALYAKCLAYWAAKLLRYLNRYETAVKLREGRLVAKGQYQRIGNGRHRDSFFLPFDISCKQVLHPWNRVGDLMLWWMPWFHYWLISGIVIIVTVRPLQAVCWLAGIFAKWCWETGGSGDKRFSAPFQGWKSRRFYIGLSSTDLWPHLRHTRTAKRLNRFFL
jgi:hypothetical protein